MEIGKLIFQEHVVMASPGNVARSTCTGPDPLKRFVHGCEHRRMLLIPR